MDQLRPLLSPLTDWMPANLRDLLPVEGWWAVYLTAALVLLLLIVLALRRLGRALFGRRPVRRDWEHDQTIRLDECPLPTRPPGPHELTVYNIPVRLRLVVLAAPGKDAAVDALAVERLLNGVLPGLGAVAAADRPRIKVWPPQLSGQGFAAAFHRWTLKDGPEGAPSRWVLAAGRAMVGPQPLLLGLGLWAAQPNMIGRLTLEPHQWLDVLRLRAGGG